MKDLIKDSNFIVVLIVALLIFIIGFCSGAIFQRDFFSKPQLIASEQWGGAVPMKIYTVYDRDTGVYYAVTETGGICVMETMSGETKLVDEGEPPVIHPNQGTNNGN